MLIGDAQNLDARRRWFLQQSTGSSRATVGRFGAAFTWTDAQTRGILSTLAFAANGLNINSEFGKQNFATAASGTPSTSYQIIAWGDSSPTNMHFSDADLAALLQAGGWARTSANAVINLWDTRYTKMAADGHWRNRNDPSTDLGFVIATSSDPSHTIVGSVTSDLGSAFSDVETFISGIGEAIWNIIETIGADATAVFKLAGFILQILKDMLPLFDPTGTSASRQAAINALNPFRSGSEVYNFITSPDSDAEFKMLFWIVLLAPVGLSLLPLMIVAEQFNPFEAETVSSLVQAFRDLVTGVAAGTPAYQVGYKIVMDLVDALLGVPIGPATAMKLVYTILSGLPVPPIMACIDIVAADPLAQQFIGKSINLPTPFVDKVMPAAMSCLNASDASQWLNCLEGVIEAIFPKLVTKLQQYAIDLNDLRTVVQSAWETGGDLNLMLASNIAASVQKFGAVPASLANVTPVQGAFIGIGFFGTDFVASKIGVQNASGFFINTLAPLLGKDIQTYVQDAYDVFRFIEQVLIEAGQASVKLSFSSTPTGFVLYALERFHKAQWDVEIAMSQMIADEFDPSPTATRLFSSSIRRSPNGQILVSPAFKALFTKLVIDFPRLGYQVQLLAAKLGITSGASLFGVQADIDSAQAAYSNKIPASPKAVTQGPVAVAAPASGTPQTGTTIVAQQPGTTPAQEGGGTTPAVELASSTSPAPVSWGAVASAAAAGFVIGGPVGAAVGAGAGLLIPKK